MSSSSIAGLRRSQIITTFGPGAIVDFSNISIMLMGIDSWNSSMKEIHEPMLENLLNVNKFHTPSISDDGNGRDIPAVIFPSWMICPKCHRISNYKQITGIVHNLNTAIKCPNCNIMVYPARLVVACSAGHIDDFPWVEWAHKNDDQICEHPVLFLDSYGLTSSLADMRVKCETCGASANLGGATNQKELLKVMPKCNGRRPWLQDRQEGCNASPRPLQRGASNVYFSVTASSISIPPWSQGINSVINPYWTLIKAIPESALRETLSGLNLTSFLGRSIGEIIEAIKDRKQQENDPNNSINQAELRYKEVKALQIRSSRDDIHSELQTTPEPIDDSLSDYLSKLTLVERLREVRVLRGFTRIDPPDPSSNQNQHLAPLAKTHVDWLPAVEVRGEGIYLELNEDNVLEWSKHPVVFQRAAQLHSVYEGICQRRGWEISRTISPRFLLVHSLAHVLIRQLALDSGYSSASIRERLYIIEPNSRGNNNPGIAGILLYTSSPDSEGSLGGLVRLGKQKHFRDTFMAAIQSTAWCSSDPLCMESSGQGPDGTNLAACHSCLLLSETCCEEFNRFLDRGMLVGTISSPEGGFFNEMIS